MHLNVFLIWIFVLSTSGVSCRWWGRLIPPFFKRNQRSHRVTKLSDVSGAGLRNLGNTCYMNSVLQSLFYSIPYRLRVMNSTFVEDSVGEKVSWLFEEMEGSGHVDTYQVASALKLNVGTQEDAQEFLLRLLNEIDSSTESDGDSKLVDIEQISSIFRGNTEQTIKCTNVDFSKSRQQRFIDLTVDIVGYDNLGKALKDMFSKPDYLTGENQYRVPKSADINGTSLGLQDAEKRLKITELPDMLCLTLKRFSFDVSTSSMMKLGDALEFPLELDMKYYLNQKNKALAKGAESSPADADARNVQNDESIKPADYLLSSIVVHEGSANFGHYICYARPDPQKNPEGWLKLNDQTVSDTTFKEVCATSYGSNNSDKFSKNAYLLFYIRKS